MADEVIDRYLEQITTTIETMRRRIVSYYDGIFYAEKKIEKAVERFKEIAEPAAYDLRDFVNQSIAETDPLDSIDTDTKNSLVEMYLGISVILIGFAGGQLSGFSALQSIIEALFDTYVVVLILAALPTYVFYTFRKNISLDDNEKRTTLFTSTMCFGILIGYVFGPRVLSLAPTSAFLPPLLFALMFDNGIFPIPFTSLDRHTFFISFASISVFLSTLLASVVLGYFSVPVSLFNIVHASGLFVHFQIIMQYIKTKTFSVGESQIAYIGAVLVTQIVFVFIFGSAPTPSK